MDGRATHGRRLLLLLLLELRGRVFPGKAAAAKMATMVVVATL
jgi:hypothetical protein